MLSLLRFMSVVLVVVFFAPSTMAKQSDLYQKVSTQAQEGNPNRLEMQEALMSAVMQGDIVQVKSLLREGVNPNFSLNNTSHKKVDPSFHYPRGVTPLMVAASKNYPPITESLLQHGANPNVRLPGGGETPLMLSAKKDYYDNIDQLLQYGAEADIVDKTHEDWTALMYAARNGNVTSVVHLLKDSTIDQTDSSGRTALYLAVVKEDNLNVIKKLLQAGADPLQSARAGDAKTPLALAAKYNEIEYVREMAEYLTHQQRENAEVKSLLVIVEEAE